MFFVSGAFNMMSNITSNDCQNDDFCQTNFITKFALPNKRNNEQLLLIQQILNLMLIVCTLAFFQYLRYQLRLYEAKVDDKFTSPSDYTAILQGISGAATDERIKTWIKEEVMRGEECEVAKISRVYKVKELLALKQDLKNLVEECKKEPDTVRLKSLNYDIEELKTKILDAQKKDNLERADTVFVAFKTPNQRKNFVNKFRRSFLERWITIIYKSKTSFEGVTVTCDRAPEPNDIDWLMISYSEKDKKWKKRLTSASAVFLVMISFALVVAINWGQLKQAESVSSEDASVTALSVISSLAIFILNLCLVKVVSWLTHKEMNSTNTVYEKSMATKLATAQFVNSCFTTLIAKLFTDNANGPDSSVLTRLQKQQLYTAGAVIENTYYLFIINMVLTPFLSLIEPANLVKLLQIIKINVKRTRGGMTQLKLNKLYEGPRFYTSKKYANVIKSMLFGCFYCPSLPFSLFFTFFTLIGTYWCDKYALLRVAKRPPFMGSDLAFAMVDILEFTMLMFTAGNIFFSYTLKETNGNISYISKPMMYIPLALSLVNVIFPMRLLNEKFFKISDSSADEMEYEEARMNHFDNDYDVENPVTSDEAKKKFEMVKSSLNWTKYNSRNTIKSMTDFKSSETIRKVKKRITNILSFKNTRMSEAYSLNSIGDPDAQNLSLPDEKPIKEELSEIEIEIKKVKHEESNCSKLGIKDASTAPINNKESRQHTRNQSISDFFYKFQSRESHFQEPEHENEDKDFTFTSRTNNKNLEDYKETNTEILKQIVTDDHKMNTENSAVLNLEDIVQVVHTIEAFEKNGDLT